MKQTRVIFAIFILMLLVFSTPLFAGELKTAMFKVDGMTCTLCVPAVKKALERTNGVKNTDVIYKQGKAVVEYDPEKTNAQALIKAIEKVGYKASLLEEKKK